MKSIFKKIITQILQWEARLILHKHKPKIIGVTGSVGKTSTKDAIVRILTNGGLSVRGSAKSYNSDLGVPLTILGCGSAWNDPLGWLEIMVYGLRQLVTRQPYPKWLVLEVGLEYPGDIKKILKWVKFEMAVVTLLPEIPVHVEFFKSKEDIINEKMSLARSVLPGGQVFLNADDKNALKFVPEILAETFTYGWSESADYRIKSSQVFYEKKKDEEKPAGLEFVLAHNEKELPVRIQGVIGDHQICPVLAALAVGEKVGLKMTEMIESLDNYLPPAGRLHLISGIKDTLILDDTYNASPAAVSAGLQAFKEFKTKGRKIAVLGDMLQLGGFTVLAHKKIGEESQFCDLVVTVGLRAKFIDDALRENNYAEEKIKHFDDSVEAGKYLQEIIEAGDVIFVKGSQGMRMEKVVEEVMAEPENKAKLLVRQDPEWQKR